MSLLLEALKKAEKAKEEAQRRASAEPQGAEAANASSGDAKAVLTRDKLPDISTPLEIVSDDLPGGPAAKAPALEPLDPPAKAAETPAAAQPARRGAPNADEAGRATAKKVFEAKFREPNPRMPFYITVGVLGLFAVGTVVYFWYQLRPPAALVNLNPPRPAETPIAAAPVSAPPKIAATATAAPGGREAPIPGLPGAPSIAAPASKLATPTVREEPRPAPREEPRFAPREEAKLSPREEPRVAPRALAPRLLPATPLEPQAAPTRAVVQVNPKVESAYSAYQSGDLTKARADYEEALREEPGNRDAILGLAALDVRNGRYESAEALYLKALQADPRDAEAQAALLALRAGRSDPLATESRVKSLLAVEPGAHALNFTLGNQFAQQNRWAEAQQEYLKAYAAEPDNADFAYNVAVSFDHLHERRQALEYYQRAIGLARQRGASFDLAAAQARVAQLGR